MCGYFFNLFCKLCYKIVGGEGKPGKRGGAENLVLMFFLCSGLF